MVQLSSLLVTGADGRWHPGTGDPSFLGWLTVVGYFAAAVLSLRALRAHQSRSHAGGGAAVAEDERLLARFWGLVLIAMLVLGINKQLDLQTLFTEIGRDLARTQGWYEVRRRYQVAFIVSVAVVGLSATALLAYVMRHVLRRMVGALLGLGALVTFVIVRAASFHHVDLLLMRGRIRLNWVLELGGIALIARSAWLQGRAEQESKRGYKVEVRGVARERNDVEVRRPAREQDID